MNIVQIKVERGSTDNRGRTLIELVYRVHAGYELEMLSFVGLQFGLIVCDGICEVESANDKTMAISKQSTGVRVWNEFS